MKFAVERKAVSAALASCARIVARKGDNPILSHVIVEASDGHARIRATNLDVEVSFRVPADVLEPGRTTLLAELFDGFVQRAGSDVVTVETQENGTAVARAGKSRLTIPTLDPDRFTAFPDREPDTVFAMMGADLGTALEQCGVAVSDNENTPWLCGVFVQASRPGEDLALRFVATNGHMFYLAEREMPIGASKLGGFILPKAAAAEVAKLCTTDVEIEASTSFVRFAFANGAALVTKVVEGGFPDYRRAVPSTQGTPSKVGRKELAEGIDRVALASNERTSCVTIRLSPGTLVMEKADEKRGHAIEEMAADTTGAAAFGVNGVYFAKAVRSLSSDLVDIHPAVGNQPMVLLPHKQRSPMCMISPMRIPE